MSFPSSPPPFPPPPHFRPDPRHGGYVVLIWYAVFGNESMCVDPAVCALLKTVHTVPRVRVSRWKCWDAITLKAFHFTNTPTVHCRKHSLCLNGFIFWFLPVKRYWWFVKISGVFGAHPIWMRMARKTKISAAAALSLWIGVWCIYRC